MVVLINTVPLPSLNAICSSLTLPMEGTLSHGTAGQRVSPAVPPRGLSGTAVRTQPQGCALTPAELVVKVSF